MQLLICFVIGEMGEIDWEALLEGKEPEPKDTEDISGLLSVNSDEISITASSTQSTKELSKSKSLDLSGSGHFFNLQSVNDLICQGQSVNDLVSHEQSVNDLVSHEQSLNDLNSFAQSPSPEVHASRSALSVRSNVTFSEDVPEVFNLAEEMNLMSIGDLIPEEALELDYTTDVNDTSRNTSPDKLTEIDSYTEIDTFTGNRKHYSEDTKSILSVLSGTNVDDVDEDIVTEDISEEIKEKEDGWSKVKDKLTNKNSDKKIPVFMVGPKNKRLSKDLSFSKSQEMSREKSSRKNNEERNRKSSQLSERTEPKSFNYTSFTEDITTVSDTSTAETVTQSKTSVTKVKFDPPCCKCRCVNQVADVNMKPIPLFSGVTLDSKTLDELSAMNPDKVALLNMMKAQFSLTKSLIDITSSILKSEVDDCKPTYRHTNLKETKQFIKKNQPHGIKNDREYYESKPRKEKTKLKSGRSYNSEKSKSTKTRQESRSRQSESEYTVLSNS